MFPTVESVRKPMPKPQKRREQTLERVRKIANEMTGRRFCAHHGGEAPAAAGRKVALGKATRWMCDSCINKRAGFV